MTEPPSEATIRRLAETLHKSGLATPAMMLLELLTPVYPLGDQLLVAISPLFPVQAWRTSLNEWAGIVRNPASRALLRKMLEDSQK